MFMSVHIADAGTRTAMAAYRAKPDAKRIEGCRYAETFLTANFRKATMPSLVVTGVCLLAAWDDDEALDRFLSHPLAKPYEDGFRTRMVTARSVGVLPGLPDLPRRERPTGDSPIAALTCGKVRANKFLPFVATAAAAEREATSHPGFLEGVTLMRPPLVIGTFSLWRNANDMRNYVSGAHPGGHRQAMATDKEKQFNHDMFFSRHVPYEAEGQWKGRNPLAALQSADGSDPAHNGRVGEAIATVPRRGEPVDGFGV
jgi:hypothetical protein